MTAPIGIMFGNIRSAIQSLPALGAEEMTARAIELVRQARDVGDTVSEVYILDSIARGPWTMAQKWVALRNAEIILGAPLGAFHERHGITGVVVAVMDAESDDRSLTEDFEGAELLSVVMETRRDLTSLDEIPSAHGRASWSGHGFDHEEGSDGLHKKFVATEHVAHFESAAALFEAIGERGVKLNGARGSRLPVIVLNSERW
jgi:hypothetical protein